jgi:parvulin-like peptidyl-prolyl isomerase
VASIPTTFIPLLFLGAIIIAALAQAANTSSSKNTQKSKQYTTKTTITKSTYQQYTPQFNTQMEIDIRLPYRRFKQLYPNNNITYDEYKKLQVQAAFKHPISSQKNHRMVR